MVAESVVPRVERDGAPVFADVLAADLDWVRAEFDEIVSANFLEPPVPSGTAGSPRQPGVRRPRQDGTRSGRAGALSPRVRNAPAADRTPRTPRRR